MMSRHASADRPVQDGSGLCCRTGTGVDCTCGVDMYYVLYVCAPCVQDGNGDCLKSYSIILGGLMEVRG